MCQNITWDTRLSLIQCLAELKVTITSHTRPYLRAILSANPSNHAQRSLIDRKFTKRGQFRVCHFAELRYPEGIRISLSVVRSNWSEGWSNIASNIRKYFFNPFGGGCSLKREPSVVPGPVVYRVMLVVWHKLSIQGRCGFYIGPESRVCARPPASPCNFNGHFVHWHFGQIQ